MAKEFRLTIRYEHAIMLEDPNYQIADILRKIAEYTDEGSFDLSEPCPTQSIHDFNGARIGSWVVTEDGV
jgi:hypothetical protein